VRCPITQFLVCLKPAEDAKNDVGEQLKSAFFHSEDVEHERDLAQVLDRVRSD